MYDIQTLTPSETGLTGVLPLWLHPEFLAAVEELHGCRAQHLACFKGEKLLALMPLFEKSNLGIKRVIKPMSAYYQGLWFLDKGSPESNRELLDQLRISEAIAAWLKANFRKAEINLTPQNRDVRGFTWAGMKAKPLYTFVHELNTPLQVFSDERRKIRMAGEQGYTFDKTLNTDAFLDMLKELNNRKEHVFRLPYGCFGKWMKRLHNQGLLTQFNMLHGTEIVSSDIMLGVPGSDVAYFIMKCTKPEEMKNGASAMHSVKVLAELSTTHRFADFCGANVEQVARFKAAMGFRLEVFFQIRY